MSDFKEVKMGNGNGKFEYIIYKRTVCRLRQLFPKQHEAELCNI